MRGSVQGNTKERLIQAFEELETKKAPSKITVKDVVEACGITRKTFYYHFKDIFDLIETVMKRRFEALFRQMVKADTPEESLQIMFRFFCANRQKLQDGWYSIGYAPMRDKVVEQIYHLYRQILQDKEPVRDLPRAESDMAIRLFTYAVIGIGLEARLKTEEDIQEAARRIISVVSYRHGRKGRKSSQPEA